MRKFLWGISVLAVAGIIVAVYLYQRNQKLQQGSVYNPFSQSWETAQVQPDDLDREVILERAAAENSAAYNPTVMRGFFESYDSETNQLTIRATVAFTQNNLHETRHLKLNPSQSIYCVPETYTDPNTGSSYPIEKLMVPVQPEQTLFLPNEQTISLDQFLTRSTDRTYLLVQLTNAFNLNNTNYIQKIIAVGLCEWNYYSQYSWS